MKVILLIAFILFFPANIFAASTTANSGTQDDGWVKMPAGAKQAFMGIHGGTMPISLLVSRDGSSLLSFVGQTGNDFLEALRNVSLALPSFANATMPKKQSLKTDLFAGNATISLPVFTADSHSSEEWLKQLVPFGFSRSPLPIEGTPAIPRLSRNKKFRNYYLPGSLQLKNINKTN